MSGASSSDRGSWSYSTPGSFPLVSKNLVHRAVILRGLGALASPPPDIAEARAGRARCLALLHGSERGRIGPRTGSLQVSASTRHRLRHPELGHSIEDVHADHRPPPLPVFGPWAQAGAENLLEPNHPVLGPSFLVRAGLLAPPSPTAPQSGLPALPGAHAGTRGRRRPTRRNREVDPRHLHFGQRAPHRPGVVGAVRPKRRDLRAEPAELLHPRRGRRPGSAREPTKPSVCRRPRWNSDRSVRVVSIATSEYSLCAPGRQVGKGVTSASPCSLCVRPSSSSPEALRRTAPRSRGPEGQEAEPCTNALPCPEISVD